MLSRLFSNYLKIHKNLKDRKDCDLIFHIENLQSAKNQIRYDIIFSLDNIKILSIYYELF